LSASALDANPTTGILGAGNTRLDSDRVGSLAFEKIEKGKYDRDSYRFRCIDDSGGFGKG